VPISFPEIERHIDQATKDANGSEIKALTKSLFKVKIEITVVRKNKTTKPANNEIKNLKNIIIAKRLSYNTVRSFKRGISRAGKWINRGVFEIQRLIASLSATAGCNILPIRQLIQIQWSIRGLSRRRDRCLKSGNNPLAQKLRGGIGCFGSDSV